MASDDSVCETMQGTLCLSDAMPVAVKLVVAVQFSVVGILYADATIGWWVLDLASVFAASLPKHTKRSRRWCSGLGYTVASAVHKSSEQV